MSSASKHGDEPPLHPAIANMEPCPEPVALRVQGTIPAWLSGSLYRVGPGTFDFPKRQGRRYSLGHWFDGVAMMHKFAVDGESGSVSYRSRCIAEEKKELLKKEGGSYSISFGTDPCYGLFGRTFSAVKKLAGFVDERESVQNIGVDIKKITRDGRARLVSTSDVDTVVEFDPETLEVTGDKWFTYSKIPGLEKARGTLSSTHGQRDERTGEYYNFVCFLQGPPKYRVICVPDEKPAYVLAEFAAPPAYLHSFGLTEHYFILLLWPSTVNPAKILFAMNVVGAMQWQPELGVQIFVIDRRTGERVGKYKAEAFYCFHTVNSFEVEEQDGSRTVCVDLIAYEDMAIVERLKVEQLRKGTPMPRSSYTRVTVRNVGSSGTAEVRKMHEGVARTLEFGNIHPEWYMKRHRFVYVAGASEGCSTKLFDRVGKMDLETSRSLTWEEEGCSPGEPVFFPRPGGEEEDDGLLLTMVSNAKLAKSFLLMLDARTLEEVARAETPSLFPLGFHGKFVSAL